jgi:hypothetical protein
LPKHKKTFFQFKNKNNKLRILYSSKENSKKDKFYVLDMFPYPSGEGLHVGHPKGYIATDIISRFKRMNDYSVLHPMGFDAFGLPAENYAIKTKTNPADSVKKNVARYKKQLEILGFDYDWSREVNTTDPKYYKWTQWIFLKLPIVPIIGSGETTYAPIHADDLAELFVDLLTADHVLGGVFDAGGPETLSFNDMIEQSMDVLGIRKPVLHVPVWLAALLAQVFSVLPKPPITRSNIRGATENVPLDLEKLRSVLPYLKCSS